MFIQTEQTPNPATLKFLPGCDVLGAGNSADFANADMAQARSPLASALFALDGVERVFLGADFISVSKHDDEEWFVMKPSILGTIMQHFTSGLPVLTAGEMPDDGAPADGEAEADGPDGQVIARIRELLDSRVRPVVARDGGDITFHGFQEGVVYLAMRGACAGCPSSTATLKMGIENMLRHYIPEVEEVRAAE